MQKCRLALVLMVLVMTGWTQTDAAVSILSNGDFAAPVPLQGWSNPVGMATEPTPPGAFAVIGNASADGSGQHALEQEVTSLVPLGAFAFTFVFATEATPTSDFSSGIFPDSLFVSITPQGQPTFDVLFVDVILDVDSSATVDSSVTIPGFSPGFAPGFTASGRVTLAFGSVGFIPPVGVPLLIAFDVIDSQETFHTLAAIDDVSLTPVPEPGTFVLLGSTMVLYGLLRKRLRL
jgi:hypothetical protein